MSTQLVSLTQQTKLRTPRLVIARADQIKPKAMRWLWPKRVPLGAITTFAGLPGEGKSLVVAYIIATVTTGQRFTDCENPLKEPADVLILASEDDAESALVPRLMAAGADLSRVHIVQSSVTALGDEREVQLDTDARHLKEAVDANPNIKLIVIDPVTDSLGQTPMYKEQEVRKVLRPLRMRDVATILNAHLNKKEGLTPIHRVGGAGAFIGLARSSWLFATHAETKQRQMLPLKNNYASRSTPGLVYELEETSVRIESKDEIVPKVNWIGESDADANDILDSATVRADAKAAAEEFLKELLSEGPKEATGVEEAARQRKIAERTLRRAKAALRVHSSKDGKRWMWSLPS